LGDGLALLISIAFATATVITRRHAHVIGIAEASLGALWALVGIGSTINPMYVTSRLQGFSPMPWCHSKGYVPISIQKFGTELRPRPTVIDRVAVERANDLARRRCRAMSISTYGRTKGLELSNEPVACCVSC
jgi:hypothetical protein